MRHVIAPSLQALDLRGAAAPIIVVGGHSRGVGKTALVVELVKALAPAPVATVKVSQHRHGAEAVVLDDRQATRESSTGRCLIAGARRALLCRCPDAHLDVADRVVADLAAQGYVTIVESNRMAARLQPSLTCFVIAGELADDWKESSWQMPPVDLIVTTPGTSVLPSLAARWLAARGGRASLLAFDDDWRVAGLDRWLATCMQNVADLSRQHLTVCR
ncbi:MAG: hypothetical protein IT178_01210 [Acidobacteria bacterium]|nr:hypothetical protein [Acidobacteriota bacterium]